MHEYKKTNKNFATQLPRNIVANILYFLVNIIIGLLIVPYFIDTLGVAAYGLIPLATSITGYVAIVVQSLNISVSRFLTVDLQRDDYVAANKTFNTSLFGFTAVICILIPIVVLIAYFIPFIFNVPADQESGAQILFLGICSAFFIRTWSGNFTVQLFAYNRLDLQNIVNTINILFQVGLIVLFFTLFEPNLNLIGFAYLGGSVIASCVSIIFARRVCPHLRISFSSCDWSRLREIGGLGWWVIVNQIGALIFLQIDLILVNLIFGATAGGEYAIALQWVVLLRGIAGTLVGVVMPMIFTYYAQKRTETLINFTKSAVKIMGLLMALPIGLVCGFAPQLIGVWVGNEFSFLAPLMVLLTFHLIITLTVLPLFSINVAYNKVKVPGIVTFFMGIGYLILAIVLSLYSGLGYYSIGLAVAIMLILKNGIFTPWYATKILEVNVHTFIQSMLPGIFATLILGVIGFVLGIYFQLDRLFPLIITCGVLALGYTGLMLRFGLSRSERDLFASYLPKRFRRLIN